MFVNRGKELEFLHAAHKGKGPQFIVVYGKRRVGKTELVKRFFKDLPHVYFLADKASEKDQLRSLAEKVGLQFKDDFLISRGFGSWYDFFKYIKRKGRIVVTIDEFPFLIEANKAVPSLFQKGWDEELKDSRIFLILLGSSIGMMETEVLGYKSPLFGRRTGQLLIEPLDFWHTRKFFPKKTIDEAVAIYATLGGTPAYLLRFDPSADYWTNVRNNMLTTESYLFAEPEFILREELREPRNYFSILRAISMGKTKMSEIINETGFEKNVVGKYLSVLAELRIIRREVPVTEKSYEKSKKGIYLMDDHFFRFWFNFVFPNKSFINEGESEYVVKNKIKPGMDIFVSQAFEEICRSYVRKGRLDGLRFNTAGRWWSKAAELDIVAMNEDDNVILFGEAKWSMKKVGTDILADLRKKAELVEWGRKNRKEHYVLFSRKGFTEELAREAGKSGVFLVGLEKLGSSRIN